MGRQRSEPILVITFWAFFSFFLSGRIPNFFGKRLDRYAVTISSSKNDRYLTGQLNPPMETMPRRPMGSSFTSGKNWVLHVMITLKKCCDASRISAGSSSSESRSRMVSVLFVISDSSSSVLLFSFFRTHFFSRGQKDVRCMSLSIVRRAGLFSIVPVLCPHISEIAGKVNWQGNISGRKTEFDSRQ
ncbi:MAG: hypothetical protein DRI57_32150 [Deltaproteobacteria bacterium]|nr:MAG: hypothetical protein DRI57_32150 [Deltaproteobacteria bacterium]